MYAEWILRIYLSNWSRKIPIRAPFLRGFHLGEIQRLKISLRSGMRDRGFRFPKNTETDLFSSDRYTAQRGRSMLSHFPPSIYEARKLAYVINLSELHFIRRYFKYITMTRSSSSGWPLHFARITQKLTNVVSQGRISTGIYYASILLFGVRKIFRNIEGSIRK